PRVFEYSLEFGGGDHPEIPRLWALRAIGHLLEEMRLHGEKSELRDEVIRLSKRYGIITPYTSYLILEDDRRLTSTRGNEEGRFRRAASESLRQGYALGGDDAPRGAPTAEPAARDASDRALAKRAAESAERFSASSGAGAVASSRELDRLKRGEELGQAQFEGLAETTDGEASSLRSALAIAVKHVGGKTFYLQGDRWIDSLLTTTEKDLDESSLRRVVYLSEEYFDLLDEDADVAKWLSVGPNVTFVHKGKVVSIVES
ncbi:MAG TPA: hypothetical protein VK116_02020, partial [Planctomycetota bacterium]|nr:hypothetical protein [Planctomycetota bacterium]